jgi:hypothetical protein
LPRNSNTRSLQGKFPFPQSRVREYYVMTKGTLKADPNVIVPQGPTTANVVILVQVPEALTALTLVPANVRR